jgi:hypothetical protein
LNQIYKTKPAAATGSTAAAEIITKLESKNMNTKLDAIGKEIKIGDIVAVVWSKKVVRQIKAVVVGFTTTTVKVAEISGNKAATHSGTRQKNQFIVKIADQKEEKAAVKNWADIVYRA